MEGWMIALIVIVVFLFIGGIIGLVIFLVMRNNDEEGGGGGNGGGSGGDGLYLSGFRIYTGANNGGISEVVAYNNGIAYNMKAVGQAYFLTREDRSADFAIDGLPNTYAQGSDFIYQFNEPVLVTEIVVDNCETCPPLRGGTIFVTGEDGGLLFSEPLTGATSQTILI